MGPRIREDTVGRGMGSRIREDTVGRGMGSRIREDTSGEGAMGEARRDGGWERAVREPPLREKKEVARWRDSSTPLRYARNDMFPDGIGRDGNGMLL